MKSLERNPSSRRLEPPAALRGLCESLWRPRAESVRVTEARGLFLAEGLEVDALPSPLGSVTTAVATRNGYAVGPGFTGGRCRVVCRRLDRAETGRMSDLAVTEELEADLPSVHRVETGDPLPAGTDRVVALAAASVVGNRMVAIDPSRLPAPGAGLSPPAGRLAVTAGAPLTPRLQALLLARGVQRIEARAPWPVGIATIGGDLIDLAAVADGDAAGRGDVTGLWMPEAIRSLGLLPHPLGIVDDQPREISRMLRRAERLGLRTLIACGRAGDGLRDRTVEALRSAPFRVHFEEVAVDPGRPCVFAQGMGFDVLALGGKPSDAAAAFDILVAPALLDALGAAPAYWDWRRADAPSDTVIDRDAGSAAEGRGDGEPERIWTAVPDPGESCVELPFLPVWPAQRAWTLTAGAGNPRRFRVPVRA